MFGITDDDKCETYIRSWIPIVNARFEINKYSSESKTTTDLRKRIITRHNWTIEYLPAPWLCLRIPFGLFCIGQGFQVDQVYNGCQKIVWEIKATPVYL